MSDCIYIIICPLVFPASSNGHNLPFSGSLCLAIIPSAHSPWTTKAFSLIVNIMVLIFLMCSVLYYVTILRYVKMTKRNVNQMSDNSIIWILLFTVLITIINIIMFDACICCIIYQYSWLSCAPKIMNFIVSVALPLNSIMNPCFYTIRTQQFQESVRHSFYIWIITIVTFLYYISNHQVAWYAWHYSALIPQNVICAGSICLQWVRDAECILAEPSGQKGQYLQAIRL